MDIVTVFASFDLGETYCVKSLLESEGITIETFDEHISCLAPHPADALRPLCLSKRAWNNEVME